MYTFEEDLQRAVAYHGHLCAGQIIGTRMARLALNLLDIPDAAKERDLILYVEADRCIADAVGLLTDCKMGRRRLKWKDFGKSAATFLHIGKNKAVRIAASKKFFPKPEDDIKEFFAAIPDNEMFKVEWVEVDYAPEDLPGKPSVKALCEKCDEFVMDGRHVLKDGKTLCKACAGEGYYKVIG